MKTSEIYRHIFSGLKINLHTYTINAVPPFYLWYGGINDSIWRNTNIEKIYEYASELAWKVLHFHILKLRFPSIFCWYLWYFISETCIFLGLKLQSAWYIYHQCSPLLLIMVRQYTDKKLTFRKSMNTRASVERASLDFFFGFSHSKTAISFNILLVLLILYLRNCRNIMFRSQITICMIHVSWYGVIPTKHWRWENLWICERARSERAWTFLHFHILKLLFPSIFCWYFWYFISETYIFQVCPSQITICMIHISSMQFPVLTYGMAIYKRKYTDKTLTLKKNQCICEWAERARLGDFPIFTFLKLLFLSIFCWYFRYFVGTNDMLVGLHVPTKLRKSMGGGGAETSCIFVLGECTTNTGNQLVTLSTN